MLNPDYSIIGALVNIAGALVYVRETLRGKNRPNRVSWALWSVAPMIAFAAEITQHVGLQSLITFSAGFGPLLILIASFVNRKAYWKIKPFDLYCGLISLLALLLWWLTGRGDVAIVLSIVADLFAAIPTIHKSYYHPETESGIPFVVGSLGIAITILTIRYWTVANYAFPMYLLLCNSLIAGLVIIRGNLKRKNKPESI